MKKAIILILLSNILFYFLFCSTKNEIEVKEDIPEVAENYFRIKIKATNYSHDLNIPVSIYDSDQKLLASNVKIISEKMDVDNEYIYFVDIHKKDMLKLTTLNSNLSIFPYSKEEIKKEHYEIIF